MDNPMPAPSREDVFPAYRQEWTVLPEHIDRNGHVNNVIYVQWMQDIAVRHSESSGCGEATRKAGALWVVRSHWIGYHRPAFPGDRIVATTWVCNFRRALSLRKYRFERAGDRVLLATGETDWVFVDSVTGRPRVIPDAVRKAFGSLPEDQEA